MLRYKSFVLRSVVAAIFVFACGLIGSKILTRSTTLEIESSELTLSNFPFGQDRDLSFSVHNPSFFGEAQIVGLRGSCGLGCVEEVDFQPFQLKSGETKKLTVQFKSPRQAGPIEAAFTLFYTSNNRTRRKELCVIGNAVETEAPVVPEMAVEAGDTDESWTITGEVVDENGLLVEDFEAAETWSSNGVYWNEAGRVPSDEDGRRSIWNHWSPNVTIDRP